LFSAEDLEQIRDQIAEAQRVAARVFRLCGISEPVVQLPAKHLRIPKGSGSRLQVEGTRSSSTGAARVIEKGGAEREASQRGQTIPARHGSEVMVIARGSQIDGAIVCHELQARPTIGRPEIRRFPRFAHYQE
jgi:hypothetical protein